MLNEQLLTEFSGSTQLDAALGSDCIQLSRSGVTCSLSVVVVDGRLRLGKEWMSGNAIAFEIPETFELCDPGCWESLVVAARRFVGKQLSVDWGVDCGQES